MIRPRSDSDEDHVAAAINCLAWWRRRGDEPGDLNSEGEREMRESLSAIRPRLVAMDAAGTLPDGLLARVDGVIGQDLEDQWIMPEAAVPQLSDGR